MCDFRATSHPIVFLPIPPQHVLAAKLVRWANHVIGLRGNVTVKQASLEEIALCVR